MRSSHASPPGLSSHSPGSSGVRGLGWIGTGRLEIHDGTDIDDSAAGVSCAGGCAPASRLATHEASRTLTTQLHVDTRLSMWFGRTHAWSGRDFTRRARWFDGTLSANPELSSVRRRT